MTHSHHILTEIKLLTCTGNSVRFNILFSSSFICWYSSSNNESFPITHIFALFNSSNSGSTQNVRYFLFSGKYSLMSGVSVLIQGINCSSCFKYSFNSSILRQGYLDLVRRAQGLYSLIFDVSETFGFNPCCIGIFSHETLN